MNIDNYYNRIEFITALMTKDYAKAREIGEQLLKHNWRDIEVMRALSMLKRKSQREMETCDGECSIDSPIQSDNECKDSDASDSDDSIHDNVDIRIDPTVSSEITSPDVSQLNNKKRTDEKTDYDFKRKMHRVIVIKLDKKVKKFCKS